MKHARWTAKADEAVGILVEKGWSDKDIGSALGRTAGSVTSRRGVLKLRKVRGRPRKDGVVKHYTQTNKPWWKKVLGV